MQRQPIIGACVWQGAELSARQDWKFNLTDEMWHELLAATKSAVQQARTWQMVDEHNFQIPQTAVLLNEIATYLEQGPGLARLKGLLLEQLSEEERRIMFYGIGQTLGTPVSMSRQGMMMSDVTDEGANSAARYGHVKDEDDNDFLSSRARVHSTGKLRFHNDRCDVVALLCVAAAASGGTSRLASVPMIHNIMLERNPDLLALLFGDYHRSRLGEEFGDNANWYSIPIFAQEHGHFTSHYSRTFIEAAQLQPDVQKMTAAQWQAIELMHEIADEVAFETAQSPGEIQFLNNHVVFHGRTEYQDHPEPGPRRLLHRLWISMANSRPLPVSFEVLFRETRPGQIRGGIAAMTEEASA
jgi:hypothetical protein